jgi:hypothetical protein
MGMDIDETRSKRQFAGIDFALAMQNGSVDCRYLSL